MPGFLRRAATVCLVSAGVTALAPIAIAHASNASILATVKRDVPKITASQARIEMGLSRYQQSHSARSLIRAVRAQNRNLAALRRRLMSERASNMLGRRGRTDIVRGLALVIHSNGTLIRALTVAATGKPVSKRQLRAAVATDLRGNRDINAGARLLRA